MCVFFRGDERLDMSKDCLHSMSKWTMITFVCLIVKGRSKIWREEKGKPCHSGFTNRCWIEKCASAVSVFSDREKEKKYSSVKHWMRFECINDPSFISAECPSRERENIKKESKPNLYAKQKSSSSLSPLIGTRRKALIHSASFAFDRQFFSKYVSKRRRRRRRRQNEQIDFRIVILLCWQRDDTLPIGNDGEWSTSGVPTNFHSVINDEVSRLGFVVPREILFHREQVGQMNQRRADVKCWLIEEKLFFLLLLLLLPHRRFEWRDACSMKNG